MTFQKLNFTSWVVNLSVLAYVKSHELYQPEHPFRRYLSYLAETACKGNFMYHYVNNISEINQLRLLSICTDNERAKSFVGRKHYVRKHATKLVSEHNIEQIIVLGAGIDGLAAELLETFPNLIAIEVDRENINFKKHFLNKFYNTIIPRIECIQANLLESLNKVLYGCELYHPAKRTLWVAEGVLMYLGRDAFVRLLGEIADISPQQYFLFSVVPPLGQHFKRNLIQEALLRWTANTITWRVAHEDIMHNLQSHGWNILDCIAHNQLLDLADNKPTQPQPNFRLGENMYLSQHTLQLGVLR